MKGKPAPCDFTVTSPLTPAILTDSTLMAGAAAEADEKHKRAANDPKSQELGWICVPRSGSGDICKEAHSTLSHLASRLAIISSVSKFVATAEVYGRLNFVLIWAVARALPT